jgi:hypothetical protein
MNYTTRLPQIKPISFKMPVLAGRCVAEDDAVLVFSRFCGRGWSVWF